MPRFNARKMDVAVLGGGCFWCTEAVLEELRGVISVKPGYAGGHKANPSYEEVSSGTSGHAEVTQIEFDPAHITYNDLLTVFFASHDPTTLNRQGNDVGTQYRSIIFYTNEQQKEEAERFIQEINQFHPEGKPVVTEVKLLEKFYPAETYHEDYYRNNPDQPYCQLVINPKLDKVKKQFANLLKSSGKN